MRETIHTLMDFQTKILAYRVWLSKHRQVAYTQDEIYLMEEVLKNESALDKLEEEFVNFMNSVDMGEVEKVMQNLELMQTEYQFSYEDQRKSIKEVIGKDFTVEEILEWGER